MKVKILIFFLIIIFLSFIFINESLAAVTPNGGGNGQSGIEKIKSEILKILSNLLRFLFAIFMVVGAGLLIFLGVKYVTGQDKVEELHRSLLYLILGISLLILSFFIPNIIKNFIEQSIK